MTERPPSAGLLPRSGIGRGVLIAALWTIVGLIFASPNLRLEDWPRTLAGSLSQWWAWGVVTPLVAAADRRLPFSDHQLARRLAAQARVWITQGFIARAEDGGTAILGRGGSDTSAAYFGALLAAERVEIWTDVAGMFSANPRAVPKARLLARLDYEEAQEIATTGAKVLHPRCLSPVRQARVPLWIKDTNRPELAGTEIGPEAAARHVERCLQVSPATHPPCNALNPCRLILDEIRRGCALLASDGQPRRPISAEACPELRANAPAAG